MIGYTSLGTNDLSRSGAFYDALLADFGAQRVFEQPDFIVWSAGENSPAFSVHVPFDGNAATVGNGTMIALSAASRDQVDALYKKAISLGASSEGEPGQRHENGFYAAYFRDFDGNKLNIHHMG
jgi:predicted lactoylglutathione lyase